MKDIELLAMLSTKWCSVDGCDDPARAKGMCQFHYARTRKGVPLTRSRQRNYNGAKCTFPDCTNGKATRLGLCRMHYERHRAGADMGRPKGGGRVLTLSWLFRPICYATAHSRCVKYWGKASQYRCVACGNSAKQWAYDGTDPSELLGGGSPGPSWYSRFPEFYMPMCAKCHNKRDAAKAAADLWTYRQWLLEQRSS